MDNLQKRQRMAWDLYRDYIAVGAKHELNLDSMSRKVTTLAMITPHLTTFDTARARIMNLLSNDAYMRFQSWEIYRELASKTFDAGGGGSNDNDNSNEPSLAMVPLKPNFWAPRQRKSANNAEDTGAGAGGTNDIPLRELTWQPKSQIRDCQWVSEGWWSCDNKSKIRLSILFHEGFEISAKYELKGLGS